VVLATVGWVGVIPSAAVVPGGTYDGVECVNFVGPDAHVVFDGTFTGVQFAGAGTYHYELDGPLNGSTFNGTWSMDPNGPGSISGTDVQSATVVSLPPDPFIADLDDVLTVTGGTHPLANVEGTLMGSGTRTNTAPPQAGCFLTFHVSGTFTSALTQGHGH
jgi:hypothetical protein